MNQFFSDKKKLPFIIAGGLVLLLLIVGGVLYSTGVIGGSNTNSDASTAAAPPVAAPPATPAAPPVNPVDTAGAPAQPALGGPATPPAAPPAPGKAVAASNKKSKPVQVASGAVERKDPFEPAYDAKALKPAPPPVLSLMPAFTAVATALPSLTTATSTGPDLGTAPGNVPIPPDLGRVSGIILSNGALAIYEADGTSTQVHPGDELPDGNGRVQSIQADAITVRLPDNRLIQIPETAGTGTDQTGMGAGFPGQYPGGPPMPGNNSNN